MTIRLAQIRDKQGYMKHFWDTENAGLSRPWNYFSTQFFGSQTVNCGNDSSLNPTDLLTISFFCRPTNEIGAILSRYDESSSVGYFAFYADFFGTPSITIGIEGNSKSIYHICLISTFFKWYHVVSTYNNSTGNMVTYIDGVVKRTSTSAGILESVDTDFVLGYFDYNYMDGYIDEVAVFNDYFNLSEAQELSDNGIPTDPRNHSRAANLVSWWRMGENDAHPTIYDNIGSNDGTMINMSSSNFVTNVP